MWDPRAFERLWRAEFPGAEAPALRLETAQDVERELERCSLNLARLQQVLAQERFKASHLRALLAGEGRAAARDPQDPRDPEAAAPCAGRSWAAAVHQQLLQPQLRFCAREGEAGAGGDSETLDPNQEFALGPWLAAPCRFRMRGDEAEERLGRESSPHRGTPPTPTPGSPRPPRGIPDLEQLEAEEEEPPRRGARDHLPPWRRRRFLRAPERDSPAHSSPERDSDGSRHSSDREDGFSAGATSLAPSLKLVPALGLDTLVPAALPAVRTPASLQPSAPRVQIPPSRPDCCSVRGTLQGSSLTLSSPPWRMRCLRRLRVACRLSRSLGA
ncbi:rho GTPase-activating protein 17-like [Aotus nancymaae]|uniref:rho GTPase-activating protein 17-like n=1 Tax=Aotus nancymaae TaxID=37293 RepID=UPI0030FEB92D